MKKVWIIISLCLLIITTTACDQLTSEDIDMLKSLAESHPELLTQLETLQVGRYTINDTGSVLSYDNRAVIEAPKEGQAFYGQDSTYVTNPMTFTLNPDGTVTDEVTGLTWLQPYAEKMTYQEALAYAETCQAQGYSDWRLPTIKELYSLIDFSGNTKEVPYINRDYFDFHWGSETGERAIDSQYASATLYQSTTMNGNTTMFGVNFADGRIKGYPITKTFYVMLVRGNEAYGINVLVDMGNGTILDEATGLMWMTLDSGGLLGDDGFMDWEEALDWAEDFEYGGYDDWKLPDAKELQSIVDYTRSPDSSDSPAIDPMFESTEIVNLMGEKDYAYYWTSTTHAENNHGASAVYICFGRGMGEMNGRIMDVHGAGSQRSDPKSGDEALYPLAGHGPQGDVQVVYNLVRLVRKVD